MLDLVPLSKKLSQASRQHYNNPYTAIAWPEQLDLSQWQYPPECISIYGLPEWQQLDDSEQKKLAFHESANFFSINIHGEQELLAGMARRAYNSSNHPAVTEYLHHFIDEENKHMIWFGQYCLRYAGRIYPDRKMSWPAEYLEGEEDFLFFAKVMIFELLVDAVNVVAEKDERLCPLVRQIHSQHHRDESRHLAFGEALVAQLKKDFFDHWPAEKQAETVAYLSAYKQATWREYYNPDVYRDAGFGHPYELQQRAWESPVSGEWRSTIERRCSKTLRQLGLASQEIQ